MWQGKGFSTKISIPGNDRGYLKENGIRVKDGTDMNDRMSIILESAFGEKLDEDLDYRM